MQNSRILFAVFFGYLVLFATLPASPLLDLPNHLTRASLISQVFWDGRTGYHVELDFLPYILGDLMLALLTTFVSWQAAEFVWTIVTFLAFPTGVYLYARARGLSPMRREQLLLFALFAGANWFFLSGFTNFCIGIGLSFLTAAVWEKCVQGEQLQRRYFIAFCLCVASAYTLHLATFLFAGVIIAASSLYRFFSKYLSFSALTSSAAPFVVLSGVHVLSQSKSPGLAGEVVFRPLLEKPLALGVMFVRYNVAFDVLLCFSLAIGLLALAYLGRRESASVFTAERVELLWILLALIASYLILPVRAEPAYGVDTRALPSLSVFAVFFMASFTEQSELLNRWLRSLLATVALLSLLYLFPYMRAHSHFVAAYDEAWKSVPDSEQILPITTTPNLGRVRPLLHRAQLYLIEHQGFVPYVFSENTSGAQIKYFSFDVYPYAPHIKWYLESDHDVDWEAVRQTYSHVVVTKPFDQARIPVANGSPHFENDAAAVFTVK